MTDRRVPPNDEGAERAVLGAVLLEGRPVLEPLTLTVADFSSGTHRTIYTTFLSLAAGDVPIDAVTVKAELERSGALKRIGGEAFLAQLAYDVPSAEGAPHFAEIVERHATARNALNIYLDGIEAVHDGKADTGSVAARLKALGNGRADSPSPLVSMDTIERRRVEWLWPGYLPLGKLTLLAGDPEAGKTLFALWIAARVSKGDPLPDPRGRPVEQRQPANVIYLTAEDDLADTLGPRLDAAGADSSRIFVERAFEDNGVTLRDVDRIDAMLTAQPCAQVVVDPVQAFMGSGLDAHKAHELRPVLTGLRRMAEKHNTNILLVAHLNKNGRGKALQRIMGSADYGAAVRAALFAGTLGSGSNDRHILPAKSSLTERPPGIRYEITTATVPTVDGPAEVGLFKYLGASDVNEAELLDTDTDARSSIEEATEFLRAELAEGPKPSDDLFKAADAQGISTSTLKRAKKKLGVHADREGVAGEGRGKGCWTWRLPDQGGQP